MSSAQLLIVADEDVDGGITRMLRTQGFEVISIIEEMPGIRDEQVLQFTIERVALLITQDKGYGRHVRRYGMPPGGLILVRLIGWSSKRKAGSVLEFIQKHASTMSGTFAVLDPSGSRIARWP